MSFLLHIFFFKVVHCIHQYGQYADEYGGTLVALGFDEFGIVLSIDVCIDEVDVATLTAADGIFDDDDDGNDDVLDCVGVAPAGTIVLDTAASRGIDAAAIESVVVDNDVLLYIVDNDKSQGIFKLGLLLYL